MSVTRSRQFPDFQQFRKKKNSIHLKVGSLYWVDRMLSFGPKLHHLYRTNDSVTSRVLEIELIPLLWGIYICGPLQSSKKVLSMVAHQAHR